MNKIVKIALVVVIVAGFASLWFAFKLGTAKNDLKASNTKLTDDVAKDTKQLDDAKKQIQSDAAQLAQAQTVVANANAETQAAKTELTSKQQEAEVAKAKASILEKQVQETSAKLTAAEDTLQKIQRATPGGDAADIGTKLTALGDENKVLSEQLINMRTESQRLRAELAKKTETPVGVRGKVAAVEDTWNFVVLNVGQSQHVTPNAEFIVYRDTKVVSKVQVQSVGRETSIAEIMPDYKLGPPRIGDAVLH